MRKGLRNLLFFFILLAIITSHIAISIVSPLVPLLSNAVKSQKKTFNLILKNEKTLDDIAYVHRSLSITQRQAYRLAILAKKLSVFRSLRSFAEKADILASTSTQLPRLLGDGHESKFALLFLNNYELRPGGGFIGSLGFVTLKNYSITHFEVQDVYEIDGQITTHHDPHYAVRKYLNQPNEFLRDSNFSPDFSLNAQKTLRYLSKVPAYKGPYIMVVGITTTAFEQLLNLTGPIELTDYNTTITSTNFFTTTQRKIENEFFPGSKQKRSILQSLGNAMRLRAEQLSASSILNYLFESVKTKDLVFYAPNRQLENLLSMIGVSGSQTSTYNNWIMPVDANVGVNKMDALVRKSMELELSHTGKALAHTFKSTYTNTITADAVEKEIYKNYFQIYVPKEALLRRALLNGSDIGKEVIVTQEKGNAVFAFYFETQPASSSTILVTYDLPYSSRMKKIQFQKQTGSKGTPLTVIYKGDVTKVQQRLLNSDEVFSFF